MRFFSFWWLCARTAFWGNSSAANDWQWIFANPLWQSVGSAVGAALGAFISSHALEAPLMSPDTPMGVFLGGLFGFCATWIVFFFIRFVKTPPTLYFGQKDRADKLEGIAPSVILSKRRKPIAVLVARYVTNKTLIQRQALDHEADAFQAIQDVEIIFNGLTAETADLTNLMNKNNRKINSAKEPQKKRQAVKNLADYLNSYSDRVEELVAIIRGMTPILLECTSRFLERTASRVDRVTLDKFIAAVDGNVKSISGSMDSARGTVRMISDNFRGVTQDLNNAASRVELVMGDLDSGLNEYRSACEQIRILAEENFRDGEANRAQASI